MAYSSYGYTCCRILLQNTSLVCMSDSKKNYTSYCHIWVIYGVIDHCESIATTFKIITLWLTPLGAI